MLEHDLSPATGLRDVEELNTLVNRLAVNFNFNKSAVMPAPSIPFTPCSQNTPKVQKAFYSLQTSSQLHLDCNLDIELTENTSRCFVTLLSKIALYSREREREREKDLTG